MAKKKKKKTTQPLFKPEPELTEAQYYWCVNCGHHGDYGKVRKRGLNCEMCDYDSIALYELEEINDPTYSNIWIERFKTKAQALKKEETKTETKKSSIQEKIDAIRNQQKRENDKSRT